MLGESVIRYIRDEKRLEHSIVLGVALCAMGGVSYLISRVAPDQNSEVPICAKDGYQNWGAAPADFDFNRIAADLGVSIQQARHGQFGTANCEMSLNQSVAERQIVVRGIGSACLILRPIPPKTPGGTEVLAYCADE